jgi:hypothetical protein
VPRELVSTELYKINGCVSESDFEKNRKMVPGPGAYLADIQEKIILHDGAYKTPGGK